MERKYDAVIFDLDGTLLDTLDDLTDSVNAVMGQYKIPNYSREQIRSFVGNGIRKLMQLVIPNGEAHPQFMEICEAFRTHYGIHCMDKTQTYPGVMQLLEYLYKSGYKLAVVSNKADFAVKKLRDYYFHELIEVAIGEREDIRKKPAPDTVYQALKELGVSKERAVYIGDSEVDIKTASNAEMDEIIVTWGFRDRDYLFEQGAKLERIANNVNEVKKML